MLYICKVRELPVQAFRRKPIWLRRNTDKALQFQRIVLRERVWAFMLATAADNVYFGFY